MEFNSRKRKAMSGIQISRIDQSDEPPTKNAMTHVDIINRIHQNGQYTSFFPIEYQIDVLSMVLEELRISDDSSEVGTDAFASTEPVPPLMVMRSRISFFQIRLLSVTFDDRRIPGSPF